LGVCFASPVAPQFPLGPAVYNYVNMCAWAEPGDTPKEKCVVRTTLWDAFFKYFRYYC